MTPDLPPLYRGWLDHLLQPLARESRAECSNCSMCSPSGEVSPAFFDPTTKCCTYEPDLPNYLVGRLLADSDPALAEGRRRVEARLTRGTITPLGIPSARLHHHLYRESAPHGAFGHSHTLRCPYFDNGNCSIWQHRESTCSTWFCKHVRGAAGRRFWRMAVHPLLVAIERTLTRWCLSEVGLEAAAVAATLQSAGAGPRTPLGADALDDRRDPGRHALMWGSWNGREAELYARCGAMVSDLAWSDVLRIGGAEVQLLAAMTRDAQRTLDDPAIADRLRVGSYTSTDPRPGIRRLQTYSAHDPLELPEELVRALAYFDGSPTDDVLARIERELGLALDPELLRGLVDHDLLVAP